MLKTKTLQDFFSKEIQDILQNLNNIFGMNFVAIFDLKNQELVALYVCQNLVVPDEQNRKTLFIKGKLINDLNIIFQQGGKVMSNGWNNDIKSIIDNLPTSIHTFSENLFGFIGIGLQGY